jgi:hypothetical protein
MKADNGQIARAVFFKLYHAGRDKTACNQAALRLAAGILSGSLTLGLGDIDHIIETELEKFGCRFLIGRGGNSASFNLNGQTGIEDEKWRTMLREIYDEP